MNRFGKRMLSGLFISFIFIMGIYMVLTEDMEVSEVENRTLAQLPELTKKNTVSGDYMKDFESYFTDHFPARDFWIKTYTELQLLTNKTYVNDYYIGEDGWIMPKPSYSLNKNSIDKSTEEVNEFADYVKEQGKEFYYFMVPHKETLFQSVYPSYIKESTLKESKNYFLSKLDEDIIAVDMVEDFNEQFTSSELETMYFNTDHHWNGKGALEGYKIMAKTFEEYSNKFEINEESLNENHYQKECITPETEFVGSYNKQIYMTVDSEDNEKMCVYMAEDFSEYEVYREGNKVEPERVYFSVSTKNDVNEASYAELYTNDYRELTIVNPNIQQGKLLVIKDSYANALVYQVAQSFHETTIYDIRHNEDRSVKEYMKENDFDYVAIVYNSKKLSGSMFEFGE